MSGGHACSCGKWTAPAHVVLEFPKEEPPPTRIRFHLACPACGADHVGLIAKDEATFARARELGDAAWR